MNRPKVYCTRDLAARPLIPRKYEQAACMIGAALLFAFFILSLSFLGGLQ